MQENLVKMDEFKVHEVIPDVLDHSPHQTLEVNWDQVKASLGNVVTPSEIRNPPQISWQADTESFYTLIMTDPDAPSRQNAKFREWHHWLVVNIPGSQVNMGEVKSEYIGAGPPQGTGLHRYVFLVFKQHGKQSFGDVPHLTNTSAKHREKFNTRAFALKHNLGELVAGNFVQAEWDDYVPILYKQLSN